MKNEINRGELFFATLDPVVGSEQGGTRPVLIIQNQTGNRHSPTTIIAPITSKQKPDLPTHISLDGQLGIEEGSVLLLEQIRTIDKTRVGKYIGQLNAELLQRVELGLSVSLTLPAQRGANPLEMTLCKRCADSYWDTGEYTLRRINRNQQIKEPCTICTRPGFDYEATRKLIG